MKQLISLFVLLLIIWIGCDDKINIEKNIFADEWIRHKIVSETYIFTDSSITQEIIYNWDGNSYYIDNDGNHEDSVELNEYGLPIKTIDEMDGIRYYIRFDRWKISEDGWIDTSGDTLEINNYTWDDLTQIKTGCKYVNCNDIGSYIEYNAYGKELAKYSLEGQLLTSKDYLDDSRRMLNWFIYNGDGEVASYWNYPVWNDYDFIALLYTPLIGDPSIPERKIEGEIDQYYNVVEENHFLDTQKSGYFNPNVSILISYDYNNSFKQIYP